ncbi:hypothetical protein K8R32_00250, partial [bacterium]|nr:hypothetical protein [bacterium]
MKMKIYKFFIFFSIIFAGFLLGKFLMADPDSPVTLNYSEFQLCTIPDSVFSGGCCSGAGALPTLRWNLVVPDTLCDCAGGPVTTVPTYKGIPTTVPGIADDCICGCGACTRDHSYQVSYWLEINKNNASFGSPELVTGEVVSGVQSYHISPGELTNGLFYWRVGIKDQYGTVTDWSEEVGSFTIPLDCTYVPGVGPGGSTALPGTEFGLCTAGNDPEPACYAGNFPTSTIRWNFSPVQCDWSDNDNLPWTTSPIHNTILTPVSAPGHDLPVSMVATQAGYWVQVDDNNNFSSPEYQTDYIASTDEFHKICSDALEFSTIYYWRVAVEDSKGSRANPVWAEHNPGSFTTAANCTPAAPTDLETETAVQPLACMYMEVHWTDNSYNEEGFLVQRSITGLGGWV